MVHYTEMADESKEGLLRESMRNLQLRDVMIAELEKMFRRYAEAKAELMLRTTQEEELLRINKLYTRMIRKSLKDVTYADERRNAESEEQQKEYIQSSNMTKELLQEQTEIRDSLRVELATKLQQLEEREEYLKKEGKKTKNKDTCADSHQKEDPTVPNVDEDDAVNYSSVRTMSDWVSRLRASQATACPPPTTVGVLLNPQHNQFISQTTDEEMSDAFTQLQSIKALIDVSEEAKSSLKRGTSP
eukprot:TRINITY_DN16673_c0_g1_i2.p2 TRINITY_DN16673_c0_g1~~TRINITY_DN16673_c0_g1_i2.p2  ORF type:complete len:245 (+),score=66.83 TRINITY_DN16673_c0_g1_i2:1014-1748(+)